MIISPTIRQVIVVGSCQLGALSAGGAMGYPMVLLHQLSMEDSPIKLTVDTASWIGSMHGLAGIASIITPTFMQRMGRKLAFIIGCLTLIVGWLVAYTATSVSVIIVSELIHGFGTNSLFVIGLHSMSEMISPRARNVCVQSYAILQALGMATSGILSTFLSAKYVCAVMSVPIIVAFIASFLWPESPSWLACKGRFDECYKAFGELRNTDVASKLEMEELIAAQKENQLCGANKNEKTFRFLWSTLKRRDFYLPVIHVYVLLHMMFWSGSAFVLINSFDIIKRITSNDNAPFWGGVVFYVIYFIGMVLNSIINKRFNNKTVLLMSAIFTSTSSFGVFLVTLLQSIGVTGKESLLCLYLLFVYVTFDSIGIIPMVFTIVSEIMPVKHRGLGGAVYVVFNSLLFASTLKLGPYLVYYINVWGLFLLYTLNTIVCGLIILKFIPETKNMTLQQIEDFYMFGKFVENRVHHSEDTSCVQFAEENIKL